MEEWHLYTDGACQPNPGAGGWAFVLHHHTSSDPAHVAKQIVHRGMCSETTNNRMEMQAVIEGLRSYLLDVSTDDSVLVLFSDSLYLVDGIENWSNRWAKNGWVKKNGDPVLNQDLWNEIRVLRQNINLRCVHIKGHSGDELNEKVDKLATRAAEKAKHYYREKANEKTLLPFG